MVNFNCYVCFLADWLFKFITIWGIVNFTCYVSCYRFFVIFLLDATEDEMRRIIPRFKNFDLENICTPINVVNLEDLLKKTGYNKEETDFLIHGFSQGFTLGYRGPCNQRDLSKNIPFSPGVGDKFDMWEKIMKEVSTGRYAGPWKFEDLPYNEFVQCLLGWFPRQDARPDSYSTYPTNSKMVMSQSTTGHQRNCAL